MPRDVRAYLVDIICDAIKQAIAGVDAVSYKSNRLIRSAVEREFIIIGEAMLGLSHRAPDLFKTIGHARRIVDFRNQLTHEPWTTPSSGRLPTGTYRCCDKSARRSWRGWGSQVRRYRLGVHLVRSAG